MWHRFVNRCGTCGCALKIIKVYRPLLFYESPLLKYYVPYQREGLQQVIQQEDGEEDEENNQGSAQDGGKIFMPFPLRERESL